jgi:hypothetical protein
MLKFKRKIIDTGEYSLAAENEWYLFRGLNAVLNPILPRLRARHWAAVISQTGSFIGSDNPVGMDGPKERMIGFKSADVVMFPVNRYVLPYGANVAVRPRVVSRKLIAWHNTFTMLTAEEHLYSHVPDFCWLDENGNYQTDWRLFSKERTIASIRD